MQQINKTFDDGNWNWHYLCVYSVPTNEPDDWFYEIAFETPDGGFLSNNQIECRYRKSKNILQIIKDHAIIEFCVDNYYDIEVILKPMIKAHNATPYKIYISKNSIRKNKLINLNKDK